MSGNPEINSFYFPNNWFSSCYDSLFASITPALRKRQVHCSNVLQWWVCSALMRPLLPAKAGTKVANALFYCWCLLCNNNMATNLQRLTLCYGSRRFACMWLFNADFLSGNATRQRPLIAVGHTHLYFVKIGMSDAVAMFPQFEKYIVSVMWPVTETEVRAKT